MSPELPISPDDWACTPVAVQAVIIALWEEVHRLREEVAALREQVGQTSCNSSRPPSTDPPGVPKRARPPSGRKAGGQVGHVGHGRALTPPAHVTQVVDVKPLCCAACGVMLLGDDPVPARHQVTEVPRVEPEVTEYRRHTLTCQVCGTPTQADWPADMPRGSFGPRLHATVGYVTGRLGLSQRDVEELMGTIFRTDVSLGSIPAVEREVSTALAHPVEQAQSYVQAQSVINMDETGWHEGSKRHWLWIATTPLVTVFVVLATRGAAGVKQVLGTTFTGIVGSDRWSAYTWVNVWQRQLCWAHLKRDIQALVDRGGASACLGHALLDQVTQLFALWHRVRDGTLDRRTFQTAMEPIRRRVGVLLREGATLPHAKTRHTCQNILKFEPALWTFVSIEGVEPTNNSAERPLRRAVLWRRRSFGTQSTLGSRFVERILTTVTTLRQQKRDVLDYLTEACEAAMRGDEAPSLLPHHHVAHLAA